MDKNWKDKLRHKVANEYGNLITRDSVGIEQIREVTANALNMLQGINLPAELFTKD